jgi:hypothetical protein
MEQIAQQAGNAASGGGAAKAPGVAIPSKTLAGFLPNLSGYTREGEPEVMDMDMNGVKYSHASSHYSNGNKRIDVMLYDYNYISALSAAYVGMLNMNMETNDAIFRSEKFGGHPGWFEWDKKNSDGKIGVFVNERVMCIVEAREGVSDEELRAAANSINFSGIASAAK